MSFSCHRLMLAAAALALAFGSSPAQAQRTALAPDDVAPATIAYLGEVRWDWSADDGEKATLRLAFTALPSGDYLVVGSFLLDDAELGVTGSGRWRKDKLILDLTTSGGVRHVPPDEAKRRFYADGSVPALVDATGFAMVRAHLDAGSLDGVSQQYQTNVVTGDHVQGPIQRTGILKRRY